MIKVNYYKMKYDALDNFYLWADQGNPYRVAYGQSIYYCIEVEPELQEIWDVVLIITMAIRLKKYGEPADSKRESILSAIDKYNNLDWNKYCFTDEEYLMFIEDVNEVKKYISYPTQIIDHKISNISKCHTGKINYYKIKCGVLEAFHDRVEKGISFQEAAEQCTTDNKIKQEQIEEIITVITIVIRFDMCGKKISQLFGSRLKRAVELYGKLDLKKYGMTDDEIEHIAGEVKVANCYIKNTEK